MNAFSAATSTRLALLALVATLAGCSTIEGWFSSDKDGADKPAKSQPLEVPPDLSQLSGDSRYQVQGGVISASGAGASAPAATSAAPGEPTVALDRDNGLRIERDGQIRWLVVPQPPEQLWPRLRDFWDQRGFKLQRDEPQVGMMDTDWYEDKSKAPAGFVRRLIGNVIDNVTDTGLRDAYRTRVERTPTGSEIYITQRGIEEVWENSQHDATVWRPRPNDPQLEAEMLSRLMIFLSGRQPPAGSKAAAAAASAATMVPATVVAGAQPTTLVVEEGFDRAWRRVGLALDRGGFTVEDRDRTAGLYYVRWVDPKNAGKEDPGWWARLWGDHSHPQEALRFRIALKPTGEKTLVAVQNSTGELDTGDNARRIAQLLSNDLH